MKKTKINQKGQMGLDMVQAVFLTLLILAVVGISLFIALNSLVGSSAISATADSSRQDLSNETITLIDNSTGGTPISIQGQRAPITYSNLIVTNETGGEILVAANFTTDSNGTFFSTATSEYNNSDVNISGQFTFTIDSDSQKIIANTTSGTRDFFSNIPTVMTILGAVVIILAVVLIIVAVGRIRRGSEEGGI